MTPSPRKTAPPTFEQTWDEMDAAFLDPTSLSISRVPRAWERKQDTKTTVQGKQKKVWRRYTTRSRASQPEPEEDEDEHDSRARAVKKLQRMSPDAMEKSATMRRGSKRAFKATRWDPWKSVLPRKKATSCQPSLANAEHEHNLDDETSDAAEADVSDLSFSAFDVLGAEKPTPLTTLIPDEIDRRGTFTFTMDADQAGAPVQDLEESSTSHLTPSHVTDDSEPEEDATITHLFRSLIKIPSPTKDQRTAETLVYPELPQQVTEAEPEMASTPGIEHDEPSAQHEAYTEHNTHDAHDQLEVVEEDSVEIPESSSIHDVVEEPKPDDSQMEEVEVSYPLLPTQVSVEEPEVSIGQPEELSDDGMSHDTPGSLPEQVEGETIQNESVDGDESQDEEFTEASLQLDLQQELETELEENQLESVEMIEVQQDLEKAGEQTTDEVIPAELATINPHEPNEGHHNTAAPPTSEATVESMDIAAGLTLGPSAPSMPSSREPTPRKLRSPSPPPVEYGPDDATMTIVVDDDTAVLKDFLSRAAASKASKAAVISRRESLQNRRDSDVVRHALASPRKVLEDKDPNSPSKYDNDATLDLSQTLIINMDSNIALSPTQEQDTDSVEDSKASRSRRSSRARKSRLPAPSSAQPKGPPKIAVRRADGGEPVVLKKTDAQELSLLTRANTRKNKQGAFAVSVRLLKLSNDARMAEDSTTDSVPSVDEVAGKKYVRWDEQLAYYQEGTDTMANMLADAESLAAPDELSLPGPVSTPKAIVKSQVARAKSSTPTEPSSTPKIRKVRGLGSTNGTPGKGLLTPASLLLPDAVQEEREAAQTQPQRLPKSKASKLKKIPVASTPSSTATNTAPAPIESRLLTLDIAPVGVEPTTAAATKERRSKLATPRKVKLPQPTSSVLVDGKENQQRSGIATSTPKKGIPMPSVVVPGSMGGVETGLPRRRARKM